MRFWHVSINVIRKCFLGLLVLGLPLGAMAEPLSDVDVQLLLDRLRALRDGEESRSDSRLVVARNAFLAAVQSDAAAHDLYLKCVEKVRFEDEKRSSQDYREWKRRHKERDDTAGLRRALRHQLSWLLLTLELAMNPEGRDALGEMALERLDAMFRDVKILKNQQRILEGDVLGSVYAVAYGVAGLKVEDWPSGPMQLDTVYEELVFPPLRSPGKLDALRAAWMRRIAHESVLLANWSRPGANRGARPGGNRGGRREENRDDRPVGVERFISERRPELLWMMEKDLFAVGDEKGAALRMLKHIERYLGHKNEAKWIAEFEALVNSQGEPVPESAKIPEEDRGRTGS